MSVDSLSFGKYKNTPIDKVPSHYLLWLIKSSRSTINDVEAELYRRGEWEPPTPTPTPIHLSERARIMLTYVTDNLAGKPRSEVLKLFSSGMFGTYSQAQEAWMEIIRSVQVNDMFAPETPVDESEGLMVMGKAQVEASLCSRRDKWL